MLLIIIQLHLAAYYLGIDEIFEFQIVTLNNCNFSINQLSPFFILSLSSSLSGALRVQLVCSETQRYKGSDGNVALKTYCFVLSWVTPL